jgi:acyl-CoA thioester hydrolase
MKYEFSYRIHLDDLDYMGIVGHANWLLILQRARIDLLEALGSSLETLTHSGTAAVVKSVSLEFLAPARHRDQVRVTIEVGDLTATSVLLHYDASLAGEGTRLLKCDLRLVFVGHSGRPVRIPVGIKETLQHAVTS